MIKYIGSKRVLLPRLVEAVESIPNATSVLDLFSGTSRVGHAFKRAGYRVTSNDHNAYAHTLATCYVQADRARWLESAQTVLDELRALPGQPGYFTETFCERSRYFMPKNGARIDAMRDRITELALEPELEAIALVSLMEAADRVDSTAGVQMAYLKQWAPRARNDIELRMPDVLPGEGRATCLEALDAARAYEGDVAYLDPPYNQHSYLGNYHVWETLVRWDAPEVYGVACKRVDCRERKSPFNSKRAIKDAFAEVVAALNAKWLIVSFNNEGYLGREDLEAMLAQRGEVTTTEIPHERYVGAKIGIHNPAGEKVGKVSHTKNVEWLFRVRVR